MLKAFNVFYFEIIVYSILKSDGTYKMLPSNTTFPTQNLSKLSEDSLLSIYVSVSPHLIHKSHFSKICIREISCRKVSFKKIVLNTAYVIILGKILKFF